MSVNPKPFESKYGFLSPGFSVDDEGNVIVRSIITSIGDQTDDQTQILADFTVSEEPTGSYYTIEGVEGTNPTISINRSKTILFDLDFSILTFSIFDENYNFYNEGLRHSDGTEGFNAQLKQSGRLFFEVSGQVPDTLYYGSRESGFYGRINVNDPEGVFGNVSVNSVDESTSATTGALVVDGGVGIGGNVNVAGTISAKGLLLDQVGTTEIISGNNLDIGAANKINVIIDGNKLGLIDADGSSIPINNTTIDGTVIGSTTPSSASFTAASVAGTPASDVDVTNKKYVDTTATALAITFGL